MIKFAAALLSLLIPATASALDLPEDFTPLGPTVKVLEEEGGKTLYYIDEGREDWKPVIFFGGAGTSGTVFGITEFLRDLRKDLKLRVISVERDGFGLTALTEGYSYQDYASEVTRVLDRLDIKKAAFVAISGGGPYLAQTVAAMPERVTSVHMLAAFSQYDSENADTSGLCGLAEEKIIDTAAYYAANPAAWWTLGENSPTRKIPGFTHASRNDGARAFSMRGQKMDGAALLAEFKRFCTSKAADLSAVAAPAFIYYGTADTAVKPVHAAFWKNAFPNIHKIRVYEGEGHDIQYRHWDQVLIDLAGMGDKTVMCVAGQSVLVDEADAAQAGRDGGSTGICAWQ